MENQEIKAEIEDVEEGFPNVEVKAVITNKGVEIYIKGYGVMGMEDGCGSPVYLEVQKGVPVLHVWADISNEDPTNTLSLALSA